MATSKASPRIDKQTNGTDSATVQLCEEPGNGRGAMVYLSSDDLAALGVDTQKDWIRYVVENGDLHVE